MSITKNIISKFIIIALKIQYFFLKILPTKDRVVFFSRQLNETPIDFKLISDKLSEQSPSIEQVILAMRMGVSASGLFSFYINTLKQMYYLATSKVCVIDSYCLPVCVLKHKKNLTVIQLWHALGKIKKSGYQTLGKDYGRSKTDALTLKMHQNYDYIIAGAEYWNKYYCESFNVQENCLLNYGLPRIDFLIQGANNVEKRLRKIYPEIFNKPILLYAPTFRKNKPSGYREIIDEFDSSKYNLIIKLHPNEQKKIDIKEGVYLCENFSATELLKICDYLITDYSSISFEAAAIDKKIIFFLFDYNDYIKSNGLNIDLHEEVESVIFEDAKEIFTFIEKGDYPFELINNFKDKFLPKKLGNSTSLITDLIIAKVKE